MASMKKKVLSVFILLVCVAGFSLSASAEDKLKVGFVYISPIGDAGWTYQHDLGRLELEKNLGDKIVTKYIESVPEGPEAERVIRDLAQSGHDLIFTTSFGYMNPTLEVAKMFPKKHFEHSTGYKDKKSQRGRLGNGGQRSHVCTRQYVVIDPDLIH